MTKPIIRHWLNNDSDKPVHLKGCPETLLVSLQLKRLLVEYITDISKRKN